MDGSFASAELEQAELAQLKALSEADGPVEGDGAPQPLGPQVRRRYRFVGSVQGVGFRWTTTNLATSVGAKGWVRNEADGSVTAEVQGVAEQVEAVIDGLNRYYNGRRWMGGFTVSSVDELEPVQGEADFHPVY